KQGIEDGYLAPYKVIRVDLDKDTFGWRPTEGMLDKLGNVIEDPYYQRLVLDYLQKYGQAARADLDALLLAKLPDVLDAAQKANKVKNLLQGMRRAGLVHPRGPRSLAVWHLGPGD
ncbi:MAG: hypothetical protein KDH93_17595, partial [Rhodoferax sp.]|nr:hypothetical protein [Rhodoferax sp.]